jgi:F-type H+-transporting ATPase subunit alpha
MKQVAGGMKLALAQYQGAGGLRPVRFGPGQGHQETLANGERLTEILKQGQYEPMPVERQVLQIYAATNRDDEKKRGWLRDVPTSDVQRWSREFLDFVDSKYPQVPKEIREKKELSGDLKGKINAALTEFNGLFQPTTAKR